MFNCFRLISALCLIICSLSVSAECMSPQTYAKYSPICAQHDKQFEAEQRARKKIEYECATAGDINRCIQIRMQAQSSASTADQINSMQLTNICGQLLLARMDFDEDKANRRPLGTTCKNNIQSAPFDAFGKSSGQQGWGTSDPYKDSPPIGNVRLK